MIIYGWTTLHKTLGTHEFHCPRCGSIEYGDLKRANQWLTIYFIPIIPLGSQGHFVECTSCAGTFVSEILDHDPQRPAVRRTTAELGDDMSTSRAPLPPRNASWAVVWSMILGVFAAMSVSVGVFGLIFSLAAIFTGHRGYSAVKRAPRRVSGRRLALAGLILGYGSLLVGTVLSLAGVTLPEHQHQLVNKSAEQIELDAAEVVINGASKGNAFGNSDEARLWAAEYAADLEAFDKQTFAGDDHRADVTGRYRTWCELHDDRCAFVVNVPEYRKFPDEVRKTIHLNAWAAARKVAAKKLKPGDRVAVGLRGSIFYGAVMTGTVGDLPGNEMVTTKNSPDLLPFFRADARADAETPAPSATKPTPSATPAAAKELPAVP